MVAVLPPVAATSVATVTATMLAVVLTTAPLVATSAKSSRVSNNAPNPVSISAKKVAVLTLPVAVTTAVVTALNSAAHLRTPGTKATAALHRVKTPVKTVHVKVAVGKSVAVITAMQPDQPPEVLLAINLAVAPNPSAPATSSLTPLPAKALPSAAVHAC